VKTFDVKASWPTPFGGTTEATSTVDARNPDSALTKAKEWAADCGPVMKGEKVTVAVTHVLEATVAGQQQEPPDVPDAT
jgi:hypothetical protein